MTSIPFSTHYPEHRSEWAKAERILNQKIDPSKHINIQQSVKLYHDTLRKRDIVPSDLSNRMREIYDKAGYYYLWSQNSSFRIHNTIFGKASDQTIDTSFGKIQLTFKRCIESDDIKEVPCPFDYTTLKTHYCHFHSNFETTFLNTENGKSVVLAYSQLHYIACHEFPLDLDVNKIADFVFGDANPPTV